MDKKTKTLISGYIEKSKEKLKTAKNLFKLSLYDDAVSRAYYSAFHAAQAALLAEGLNASTHQGLIGLFSLHFIKSGKIDKRFGKFLAELKDDRERGDYEIYSNLDKQAAARSIREADLFFKEVASLLKN